LTFHQKIDRPRKLARLWQFVIDGLPSAGRYRRYAPILCLPLSFIWLATALYLMVAPQQYESKLSLILPGSGSGGSLNVDDIGQAQSSAASAFSSTTLSPTENYKRLLMADVTMRSAAHLATEREADFPAPDVKLVDQTNLIEVQINGGTPAQAQRRAKALLDAFLVKLDSLRNDEAEKRETADAAHLSELAAKVQETQRKLFEFQTKHGLVSIEQFNARISGIDALRDKALEMRALARQDSARAQRLLTTLEAGPRHGNKILRLKSDPEFQQLAARHAALSSDAEQKAGSLGAEHAERALLDSERQAVRDAMAARGAHVTGLSPQQVLASLDVNVSDGRSQLLAGMIDADAQKAGSRAALRQIQSELGDRQNGASALVTQASELTDLVRDQRIAEALFSSALARLDTNKQDRFASYPLVQILEAPSLPRAPSSPSTLLALAGAVVASFLVLFGAALIWIRQPIIRHFFPNA
jgi:uncharacterized protein involved in exopolysaccharide biosynthesis